MLRRLPRGSILNFATVLLGGGLGWLAGQGMPDDVKQIATIGLGLVTIGMGMRLFLQAKSVLVVASAIAIGGILGELLGIDVGLSAGAEWAKQTLGGSGRFSEAIITTTVLFCVGPMTLLGCLRDGLARDMELLAIKSLLDGIAAFFFAAALGPGVLVTAFVVLIVQSTLTLLAGLLRPLADDETLLADLTGTGGPILLAIGLGLIGIASIPSENFLPALVLAPVIVALSRRAASRWNTWRERASTPAERL